MKTTVTTLSYFVLFGSLVSAVEPRAPACRLIQPQKLIVQEDGSHELAETSSMFHGDWERKGGVFCGMHGNEKHPATLKFVQPFEDCVLTFRVRFIDPGHFIFVGGGHGIDVAFRVGDDSAKASVVIRGRKPGQAVTEKSQALLTTPKQFPVGEWIDVLIEHSAERVRVKIGDDEFDAVGGFRASGNEKKVFYLNAGNTPGTRFEFDDIFCWSGTPLKP